MIDFSKIDCVGCTSCTSMCAHNAIRMRKNAEGFPEPYVADPDACTDCGLCETACPVLNNEEERPNEESAYIVQNTDESIRRESASGGMFSAIAMSVLQNDGVVYGAAYAEDFEVCHMRIETPDTLWKLRNSKYVQSNLKDVFCQVRKDLTAGRQVCFSGTPCQIEGLKHYLRREYENLLLVDIVCHGVGSPLIWEKYLEIVKKYDPKHICFRWKHYGYKYSTMSLFNSDRKEIYFAGVESDKMLRAYFSNNCDRKSCYRCQFKKRYRVSDMTMWDCFQPRVFNREFDDDRGTSCVLLNTAKGRRQFQKLLENGSLRAFPVDPDALVYGNNEMVHSVQCGKFRDAFLRDAASMDAESLFEKYFPDTVLSRAKKAIRLILVKTGAYRYFKYILFLWRRKNLK